jgi:hypothetical protein
LLINFLIFLIVLIVLVGIGGVGHGLFVPLVIGGVELRSVLNGRHGAECGFSMFSGERGIVELMGLRFVRNAGRYVIVKTFFVDVHVIVRL